jgi:hypothetical protein
LRKVKVIHLFVRNLLLYTILFLFIWQIVGVSVGFEIAHSKIKKEVKLLLKNGVPKDERVIYSFSNDEIGLLIWVKKNEFIYNDSFFDVIERSENKGQTVLECISDKQETVLFKNLASIVDSNLSDQNDDGLVRTVKKFNVKYLSVEELGLYDLKTLDFEPSSFVNHLSEQPLNGFVGIEIAPPEA